MALSNWACEAFDSNGKMVGDTVKCDFVEIEIYKSDIIIHHNDVRFCPTDLHEHYETHRVGIGKDLPEDKITWVYICLKAFSDPEGIMFVAYQYDETPGRENYINYINVCCGIGCYGFEGSEWVGVPKGTFTHFKAWLKDSMSEKGLDSYFDSLGNAPKNLSSCKLGFKLSIVGEGKDRDLIIEVTDPKKFMETTAQIDKKLEGGEHGSQK